MHDISVIPREAGFPERLASIPDPPVRLWIRGRHDTLPGSDVRSLAVVGSRAASRDGLEMARMVAGDLARAGIAIVSGLARGIDGAAHTAALDASAITVAVLGSGLDRMYPAEHASLAARIAERGALVSESPPSTAPHAGLFPRRNRLIAGLADAVVIVEARERSGALITATAALDQGKDVLVVPGRVPGQRNRGGHLLIREGAKLVESADDILLEMGWRTVDGAPVPERGRSPEPLEFTVDDLASQTGEPAAVVLARLLELELAGEVQRIGSARFVRVRGRMLT